MQKSCNARREAGSALVYRERLVVDASRGPAHPPSHVRGGGAFLPGGCCGGASPPTPAARAPTPTPPPERARPPGQAHGHAHFHLDTQDPLLSAPLD